MVGDSGRLVDVGTGLTETMLPEVPGCCEVVRLVLTRESFKFLSLQKAISGGVSKMFFVSVSLVRMLKLL